MSISIKLSQATIKAWAACFCDPGERSEEGGKRCYRYRVEFEKNTVLQRFVFDEQSKVAACLIEDIR